MAGFVTYHPPHGSGEAGLGSPTTPTARLTQRTHSAHPLKTRGGAMTSAVTTTADRQDQWGAAFPAGAGARFGASTPNFGGALYPGRSSAGELEVKSGAPGGLGGVGPGGTREGAAGAVGAGYGPSQLPGTAEKVVGALKSAAGLAARVLPWPGNSAAKLLGQLLEMTEKAIINKRNWVTLVSGFRGVIMCTAQHAAKDPRYILYLPPYMLTLLSLCGG